MINAIDLQLVDWVSVIHCGKPRDVRVAFLDNADIGYEFQNCIIAMPEKAFHPIPLTAEILEKNGFVWTEHRTLVKDDIYFYPATNKSVFTDIDHPHISIHPFGKIEKVSLRCDYVHIAQHIFRLCGRNDLADNFKV